MKTTGVLVIPIRGSEKPFWLPLRAFILKRFTAGAFALPFRPKI